MLERLSPEIIEAVFDSLPVEITFVDKEDTVRFFNKGMKRIFPRAKSVVGRKVQNCHPKDSVDVVNRILKEFRNGTRDEAVFWFDLKGRRIYIRYFPVRSKEGQYLGCIECAQDITDIQKIEGEKRLLDE
jgi:PAS domain S-box-containing protein